MTKGFSAVTTPTPDRWKDRVCVSSQKGGTGRMRKVQQQESWETTTKQRNYNKVGGSCKHSCLSIKRSTDIVLYFFYDVRLHCDSARSRYNSTGGIKYYEKTNRGRKKKPEKMPTWYRRKKDIIIVISTTTLEPPSAYAWTTFTFSGRVGMYPPLLLRSKVFSTAWYKNLYAQRLPFIRRISTQ